MTTHLKARHHRRDSPHGEFQLLLAITRVFVPLEPSGADMDGYSDLSGFHTYIISKRLIFCFQNFRNGFIGWGCVALDKDKGLLRVTAVANECTFSTSPGDFVPFPNFDVFGG